MSIPWADLEQSDAPRRGEFRVMETSIMVPAGKILAALDNSGCRHLFAPIAGIAPLAEDRNSRGVHLKERLLIDGHRQQRFVDAACQDPRWNGLFSVLAEEMLAEIGCEPSPSRAWRAVLQRWRDLLDHEPPASLSREELIGLFGELWLLRMMLEQRPDALRCWRGPGGDRHDFRENGQALEVKTTIRREVWEAEIHGVEQLLAPDNGSLRLIYIRLEESRNGHNLPELIASVQAMTETSSLARLLVAAGYHAGDVSQYSEPRLAFQEARAFIVNEDFPRIIPASFVDSIVPDRVVKLRYRIDLAGIPYTSVEKAIKFFQENRK